MTGLYVVGGVILLVVGVIAAAYIKGRGAGQDSMSAKVTEKTAEVLRQQDKAGAGAAKTKDELIDRLRKGGF